MIYSITSSASESIALGTSMPSALRRLQVDDELEFGRLQDRQVGGLGALEDVAGIDADLTKHVRECRFRSSSARRLRQIHECA